MGHAELQGKLTKKEEDYIKKMTTCRLALASKDGTPHVTPVVYVYDGKHFFVAVDYGARKLKILEENSKVALVVDSTGRGSMGGIMVQGEAEVLERGKNYLYALKLLFERFESYRKNPWGEGEEPILKIKPQAKTSWGI